MKQESKRFSSIILAALLIVGALIVYFEFIVPAYTNLETVKGQEESEKTLYANETQIVGQVKGLLSTYQNDASSSQLVAMALPVGPDVSGALAQIYGIAANTGASVQGTAVSIQAIQSPAGVAPIDETSGTIADAAAAGSVIKPTGTVSIQITGSGSYEALNAFLQGLETNIRIFDVTALTIQPAATQVLAKGQTANPDMFNYTITVVTYYQAP